jgi:hypothetical protein
MIPARMGLLDDLMTAWVCLGCFVGVVSSGICFPSQYVLKNCPPTCAAYAIRHCQWPSYLEVPSIRESNAYGLSDAIVAKEHWKVEM